MKKSFKYAYPTLFGVIFFSIFLQFNILVDPFDRTKTTKCWLLFMIVFCSAIILFILPSFKKGGADENRSAIYPALVMIGTAVTIVMIPYFTCNGIFILSDEVLPLTAALAIIVWLGLLRMEVKFIPFRIFYAILTGVTTYVFLHNILGVFLPY